MKTSLQEKPAAAGPVRQHQAGGGVADRRPATAALAQLSDSLRQSPRMARQRALAQQVGGSPRANGGGLPHQLRAGIEALSGIAMDHVKVHYNSSKPAQLSAHAYAQGADIHLGPGQEKHLPHEAWHVVQQAQGRVAPTMQAKGIAINDEQGLEREADRMGAQAARGGTAQRSAPQAASPAPGGGAGQRTVQRATVSINGPAKNGVHSTVTHTSGLFSVDKASKLYAEVGTKMEAVLYQESPLKGSPVGNQWTWMDAIKKRAATTVIRGHLLNHDLGGKGLPYNLFPISNGANSAHSLQVEQKVKGLLYGSTAKRTGNTLDQKVKVEYSVEVVNRDDDKLKADFQCKWTQTINNVVTHSDGETIPSNLGAKSKYAFGGATKQDVPDAWAKGDKEKIADAQYPARTLIDPHTGDVINIAAVKEGSDFQKTPYWKRQLGTFHQSDKLAEQNIMAWGRARVNEGYQESEINDALDIAIDQVTPLVRDMIYPRRGAKNNTGHRAIRGVGKNQQHNKKKIELTRIRIKTNASPKERALAAFARLKQEQEFQAKITRSITSMLIRARKELDAV